MGIKDTFAQKLKVARKDEGLSQKEFAEKLGVSRRIVSDWENANATPPLERLDSIASCLDKPLSYFVTEPQKRGHLVGDVKSQIVAYDHAVRQIQERIDEAEKMRVTYSSLISHFIAQATLLLYGELSCEERESLLPGLCEKIRQAVPDALRPDPTSFAQAREYSNQRLLACFSAESEGSLSMLGHTVAAALEPPSENKVHVNSEIKLALDAITYLLKARYTDLLPGKPQELRPEVFVRHRFDEARKLLEDLKPVADYVSQLEETIARVQLEEESGEMKYI